MKLNYWVFFWEIFKVDKKFLMIVGTNQVEIIVKSFDVKFVVSVSHFSNRRESKQRSLVEIVSLIEQFALAIVQFVLFCGCTFFFSRLIEFEFE